MEAEEKMILRDLPVDTRNYTIVDNITGKPIDQSTYTMTIDPEVIGKLNKLKQINEEKIKQSALKAQYSDTSLVNTFTPTDNAVFTPVYNDEYINYQDYNTSFENTTKEVKEELVEEVVEAPIEDTSFKATEVIKADSLLDRVVARDPSQRPQEVEEVVEEPKEELDYISNYNNAGEYTDYSQEESNELQADNSLFTPEMATLQQASEQIVNIDTNKLGQDIKTSKAFKKKDEKIALDKMEVIAGKKIAWTAYILFFIPLLLKGKNRFVRIHANEGLELNIMEILSGLLIAQYFLLPKFIETMTSTVSSISLVACIVGAGLLAGCLLTIIPMMLLSIFGVQAQTFWLWKRRIIKVSSERTAD